MYERLLAEVNAAVLDALRSTKQLSAAEWNVIFRPLRLNPDFSSFLLDFTDEIVDRAAGVINGRPDVPSPEVTAAAWQLIVDDMLILTDEEKSETATNPVLTALLNNIPAIAIYGRFLMTYSPK